MNKTIYRNSFCVIFSLSMFVFLVLSCSAGAEGLLNRQSGPTDLQKQELDTAYQRGYYDGKEGKNPIDYTASGTENKGEVVRGAGRGALGGAAMGSLSGGEAGKGAAWGAGMGAAKGLIKKKRAENQEREWAAELNDAYNKGYLKGVNEKNMVKTQPTSAK